MNTVKTLVSAIIVAMITTTNYGQGFIEPMDPDNLSVLFGNPCTAMLASGEEIHGKFQGGALLNGYLGKVVIKLDNGEKAKFNPDEPVSLRVKASKLAKLSMLAESASSIKEITDTDFSEIVNREYIIFETALKASKKDKARLLQLLNPGFDDKIRVYADPEANETIGVGIGDVKLTGGMDKSYLFVKGGDKAVKVKKGSYRKNFDELYSNCDKLMTSFGNDKIKWNDVAGHVFVYNQLCQ